MQNNITEKFWFCLSTVGLLLVYCLGLTVDVMDVDAAQYASIAMEMAQSGEFLEVQHRTKDYLDKPPLVFWTSALSFQIFGLSNWAYKLPSFLFTLLGILSVYRFTRLYYSLSTARYAALIYASCLALVLINNDVRTDTLLVNSVIFAVWQLAAYLNKPTALYFIGSSLGLALALLSKGPIGLMIPVLGFVTHFSFRGDWKQFLRPAWYGILLLSLVLTSPMLWGLYEQHGIYGPYFYFWEQSFGRLTGENTFIQSQKIPQDSAPLFFTHTFLWSFLPFSLMAVITIFRKLLNLIAFRQRSAPSREWITWGAFVFPFIALSFSKYKLPHYIYGLYPFAAIMTARMILLFVKQNRKTWLQFFFYFQAFVALTVITIAIYIGAFIFAVAGTFIWLVFGILALGAFVALFHKQNSIRIVFPSVLAITGACIIMNGSFYPNLLKYQGTHQVALFLEEKQIDAEKLYTYKSNFHSLDFYTQTFVKGIYNLEHLNAYSKPYYLLVLERNVNEIEESGLDYKNLKTFPYYPVTKLTPKFLDKQSRDEVVQDMNLIKMK